jgi:RNA polymerase sigma-70 factor (ECF subfamily)
VTRRGRFSDLTDAALISRFLGGEEAAFRELYTRHTPRLRMIVIRLLGAARRDEVDDVVQETWLAGCRGIHRYSGDAKFASWLTTIGIRTTYARFARSSESELDSELFDEIAAPRGAEPATAIDLDRALSRLPEHQERAGLRVGDVVTQLDGKSILEEEGALRALRGTKAETMRVTVLRNGAPAGFLLRAQ